MSAAGFILAINLFVAGLFCVAFFLVAASSRDRVAVWFGLAYLCGGGYIIFEFLLPYQANARPVALFAFGSFLAAVAAICVGVARRYRLAVPWAVIGVMIGISLLANWLAFELPRESVVRQFTYQAPYAAMQALCAVLVLRSGRRQPLDMVLLALFSLSALQFLSKPLVAAVTGGTGASAQEYVATNYALYSQTLGAVLSLGMGLLMLMVLVRDMLVDVTERSETDLLSGLFNRRGFESRVEPGMAAARGGVPAALIACDLDHFKQVNDSWGHEIGDRVIRAFAELLRGTAPPNSVAARIGGEEFAVFLPGANIRSAQLYAEAVRAAFAARRIEGVPEDASITASFGVAECDGHEGLADLRRRADGALYAAKKAGRDRVSVAHATAGDAMPDHPLGTSAPLRRPSP